LLATNAAKARFTRMPSPELKGHAAHISAAQPAAGDRVEVAGLHVVEVEVALRLVAGAADVGHPVVRGRSDGHLRGGAEGPVLVAVGDGAGIVEQGVGGAEAVGEEVGGESVAEGADEVAVLLGGGEVLALGVAEGVGLLEDLFEVVDESAVLGGGGASDAASVGVVGEGVASADRLGADEPVVRIPREVRGGGGKMRELSKNGGSPFSHGFFRFGLGLLDFLGGAPVFLGLAAFLGQGSTCENSNPRSPPCLTTSITLSVANNFIGSSGMVNSRDTSSSSLLKT
jgi:hypothetical protein